jgi:hypothetical protein
LSRLLSADLAKLWLLVLFALTTAILGVLIRFYMTSTISYVAKPQDKVSGVRKPAPPLLSPLPEDIFYPFVTSSADSLVTVRAWGISLSVLLAVLALLLQACLA